MSESEWLFDQALRYEKTATGMKRYYARIRKIYRGWRTGKRYFPTCNEAISYGQRWCRRVNRMLENGSLEAWAMMPKSASGEPVTEGSDGYIGNGF